VTDEDIVVLGLYCESLLADEQFNTLIGQFELQTVQHILGTAVSAKQDRENVYLAFTGLRDFLGHMRAIVEAKDEIVKQQTEPSSSDDALDD